MRAAFPWHACQRVCVIFEHSSALLRNLGFHWSLKNILAQMYAFALLFLIFPMVIQHFETLRKCTLQLPINRYSAWFYICLKIFRTPSHCLCLGSKLGSSSPNMCVWLLYLSGKFVSSVEPLIGQEQTIQLFYLIIELIDYEIWDWPLHACFTCLWGC